METEVAEKQGLKKSCTELRSTGDQKQKYK